MSIELYVVDRYGRPDDNGNWNGLVGELTQRQLGRTCQIKNFNDT